MIAIKKGTTEYRNTKVLDDNEVEFTGVFKYAANGITPNMVWDDNIQNVREMTANELSQRDTDKQTSQKKESLYRKAIEALTDSILAGNVSTDPVLRDVVQKVKAELPIP